MNIFSSLIKSASDFFNCYKNVDNQVINETEILVPNTSTDSKQSKELQSDNIINIDVNKNNLVDMKLIVNKVMYKRIDHFCDHLKQLKINIDDVIPQDEYNYILSNVEKYCFSKCKTKKDITRYEIKTVLKYIGYTKYYQYLYILHSSITSNGQIPQLSDKEEKEAIKRFRKVNNVYNECRP